MHRCDFVLKKLRQAESRHKNEMDDITRRYEQAKADREKLEKHLIEVMIRWCSHRFC
jgi:hypothetical protein